MHLIDTHCHLQDPRFQDLDAVLERARVKGVKQMVCCATRPSDWAEVLALAARHADVTPMLGLHPWFVQEACPGWEKELHVLLVQNPAGLGECGLDFALESYNRLTQEDVFRQQLRMASEMNRPISIHCRKAFDSLKQILKEEGVPEAGTILHAFSGSFEIATELSRLGVYFSFPCTLADPGNKRMRRALLAIPDDRLLLESDAPEMRPRLLSQEETDPLSGNRPLNEPCNLTQALEAAAILRGQTPEALGAIIYQNARRVLSWKSRRIR